MPDSDSPTRHNLTKRVHPATPVTSRLQSGVHRETGGIALGVLGALPMARCPHLERLGGSVTHELADRRTTAAHVAERDEI